jgi:bacillopeptidase F
LLNKSAKPELSMNHQRTKLLWAIFSTLVSFFALCHASQAKVIEADLMTALQTSGANEEITVIVALTDKADLKHIKQKEKRFRRAEIIAALQEKAEATQKPLKSFLHGKGVKELKPFWLINGFAVTARADIIRALAKKPGIESIRLDAVVYPPEMTQTVTVSSEWNISQIRAQELWDAGYTGIGTVIAGMDSGVDANHQDLAPNYRGGSNSWYDPHGQHSTPYDKDGHGTRTMGIMVGGTAGGTAIGVAPDAQWIAVKIFNDLGQSSLSAVHSGFQWLLDPDGNPGTDDAPDVVNNSWGLELNVNQCVTEFLPDVQVLKAAGIAVVFSAGNGGPYPATSISPANYPDSLAVGSVDDTLTIAELSSRGPSACDGGIFPQVVAPGENVTTSDLTFGAFPDSYTTVSGTSFAAPHVSGAMALLLNAFPGLTVSEIEDALTQTAVDLGVAGPDDDYGYGLIDVMAAYYALLGPVTCDVAPRGSPDGVLDIADALVMLRFASGLITPTVEELQKGDVLPDGAPDGVIDMADALVVMRAALGQNVPACSQ